MRRNCSGQLLTKRNNKVLSFGEGYLTRDEILEKCKALGFEVSKRRFAYLRAIGLIPEGKRTSLGRGTGSFALYPQAALQRTILSCFLDGRMSAKALARLFAEKAIRVIRLEDGREVDVIDEIKFHATDGTLITFSLLRDGSFHVVGEKGGRNA